MTYLIQFLLDNVVNNDPETRQGKVFATLGFINEDPYSKKDVKEVQVRIFSC